MGESSWVRVCASERIIPERAVAALAADGVQVAVVRTAADELFAVGHHDPYALANVMARGVVGTRTVDGQTYDVIQSPLYEQAFDLRTGEDVADRDVSVGTWQVRERDGVVELGAQVNAARLPDKTSR